MWIYLLKSGLCLLVLFSFYKLFLENEQFHRIKRFYLLIAVILAFSLPFITITYGVEIVEPVSDYTTSTFTENSISESNAVNWQENIVYVALGIYLMGFMFFGFRFCKNLKSLLKEVKRNEHLKDLSYIFVLMGRRLDPHSFFNYIFLNKTEFQNGKISKAVIEHEKAHVDQKHSLDLIFIEILQVIFWFNPVFYWLKKAVRLNHEFLADKKVLSKDIDAFEYTSILFNYSSGYHHNSLTSPINHSLTRLTVFGRSFYFGSFGGQVKKRIIMITKDFSIKKLLTRLGLFIPVLACCIFFFNNDIVAKPVYKPAETSLSTDAGPMPGTKTNSALPSIELTNPGSVLQQTELKIRIEGEKIWINDKSVKIQNFAKEVDEFTSDLSEAELKDLSIHMKTIDSDGAFMEDLNREFAKTRLSKVTGRGILPPPPPMPPMPPSAGQIPPPPPPAPAAAYHMEMGHKKDSIREVFHNKRMETREKMRAERDRMHAERENLRAESEQIRRLELEYRKDKKLSREERERVREDIERKQVELRNKMQNMERKHLEMERKQNKVNKVHRDIPAPPLPPKPIEEIDKIEKEGGSFYYNNKKISAEQAKELLSAKKDINIRINAGSGKAKMLEISDNK